MLTGNDADGTDKPVAAHQLGHNLSQTENEKTILSDYQAVILSQFDAIYKTTILNNNSQTNTDSTFVLLVFIPLSSAPLLFIQSEALQMSAE